MYIKSLHRVSLHGISQRHIIRSFHYYCLQLRSDNNIANSTRQRYLDVQNLLQKTQYKRHISLSSVIYDRPNRYRGSKRGANEVKKIKPGLKDKKAGDSNGLVNDLQKAKIPIPTVSVDVNNTRFFHENGGLTTNVQSTSNTSIQKLKGELGAIDGEVKIDSKATSQRLNEQPLDPKVVSSGLQQGEYHDSDRDLKRLLNFMSDDNVFLPHSKWKPSTRDRVKANGERVWREDFEIESLMPYNNRFRYSHQASDTSSKDEKKLDTPYIEQEDIDDLDKTLKAARSAQIRSDNERFRLEKTFKYSSAVYYNANPRTLERGNFFTPVYVDAFWSSSPSGSSPKAMAKEYIILTPSQKVIKTHRMPFNNHRSSSAQDMFSILSQLSQPEKYIKAITRLEKQGWSIIGGGGQGELVVFERLYNKKSRSTRYMIKLACGMAFSVGSLVMLLLLVTEVSSSNEKDSTDSLL